MLRGLALAGLGAALALIWAATESPQRASAAPCPPLNVMFASGTLQISGAAPCDDDPEEILPYCSGGTVRVFYVVNGAAVAPDQDTAVACGTPIQLAVLGNDGDDRLNLASVTAANGFTGLSIPNSIQGGIGADTVIGSSLADAVSGGSGNDVLDGGPGSDSVLGEANTDVLQLRDGQPDSGDCGTEFDAAQADQQALDSLANCEIADFLPAVVTPPPAVSPPPAAKKCKKGFRLKRGKCRRKKRK